MEKRDGRIDVRVSERERRSIESRARRANRSVSEYVRRSALGHGATRGQAVEVDGRELASAHADLKRCGGLLNQYMRAVNRYGLHAAANRGGPSATRRQGRSRKPAQIRRGHGLVELVANIP